MARSVIALLTDFGTQDHYVGVMKGVIAGIAPDVSLIDITHNVPPQSVLCGQLELKASVRYFPAGTIFLAVIDPGVGTARRPMALRSAGYTFVGPDNGLFTPWLPGGEAVELANPSYRLRRVSHTFHGRDVFAPAAAHLSLGLALERLGPALSDPIRLEPPAAQALPDGTIVGEVVYVDHFGNLVTNIHPAGEGVAHAQGHALPLRRSYGSVQPGDLLALTGSEGALEIAVRDGSAAARLGAGAGLAVHWKPALG
jgi:S-adenosylmethionine hydrolase